MKKQIIIFSCILLLSSIQSLAQRDGAIEGLSKQGKSDFEDVVNKGNTGDRVNKALGSYKSVKDFYDSVQSLKSGECVPEYSVNPQAMVPSSCDEAVSEADPINSKRNDDEVDRQKALATNCAKCYENAYKKLNDARRRLGKLKCLGSTTKAYVNNSTSVGDTVSGGIGGIQGLAWQKARKDILDSYSKFKDAYDKKYTELMDVLVEAMLEIDKCEAENGQKDWFKRSGFIYVEFMAEKYKRVD